MRIRNIMLALALLVAGAASAEAQQCQGCAAPVAPLANRVQIDQRGGPHRAAAAQRGDANTAIIRQYGQNHAASITQSGSSNAACVVQVGRHLSAEITQTGGQSTGLIQTSRGTRVVPVETCSAIRLGRGGVLLGDLPRPSRGRG